MAQMKENVLFESVLEIVFKKIEKFIFETLHFFSMGTKSYPVFKGLKSVPFNEQFNLKEPTALTDFDGKVSSASLKQALDNEFMKNVDLFPIFCLKIGFLVLF